MSGCNCDLDYLCAYHRCLRDYLTMDEEYEVRFYPDSAKAHAAITKAFSLANEDQKAAAREAWPEGPTS